MYRVLQVDDEELVLSGFRTLIDWEELGLEAPDGAASAQQALAMMARESYHILITDIRMPGMSGLDLIARIRELGSPVRIIILSGYDDFNYLKAAFQYGIENYLLKPVDVEELTNALTYTLDKIERERERIRVQQLRDSIVLDNVFNSWIDSAMNPSALAERLTLMQVNLGRAHYQVCLIRMDQFDHLDVDVTLNSREVQHLFQRCAADGLDVYATFSISGDLLLIHGSDAQQPADAMSEYCARAMDAWLHDARADWHAFAGR